MDAAELIDPAEYPRHLDEHLLSKLVRDLGQKIFGNEEIAERYGLTIDQLYHLAKRPAFAARVKREKAIWSSEEYGKAAMQHKAAVVVNEAIPTIGSDAMNPNLTPGQRKDAFVALQRMAGLDGAGGTGAVQGGPTTAPVSINITFAGSGQTETFTTVVDHQPALEIVE
jgi:hypothetical protein